MTLPRSRLLAFILAATTAWFLSIRPLAAANVSAAIEWYDSLGFPDVKDLPYVRVATGMVTRIGNRPFQNRFTEGFLMQEDATVFTVFVCSIPPDFRKPFPNSDPYPSPAIIRFIPKIDGPVYGHIGYETLDFGKAAEAALARVRAASRSAFRDRPRIFAFGRACAQKGQPDLASEFLEIAGNIPDLQTGKVDPARLREFLQIDVGGIVLDSAEEAFSNTGKGWSELLEPYATFEQRYPASPRVPYAREAADLLRKMIAEETGHRSKPFDQMTPEEQAAEYIYQLRELRLFPWLFGNLALEIKHNRELNDTPVQRLVALGDTAIPRLIEALDDRRFTHTMVPRFNGVHPPLAMRVADMACEILEQLSGQNFRAERTMDGRLSGKTSRQMAEAWWAESKEKGERQRLIDATAMGGASALRAAPMLIEKYPNDAIAAIKTGIRAPESASYQSQLLEIAARLPGEAPVELMQSMLAGDNRFFARVHASEWLMMHGHPEVIPPMIEAWEKLRPRLDDPHTYDEAGPLIGLLGSSSNARAIEALGKDLSSLPVDVKIAIVQVLLPSDVYGSRSSEGRSIGPMRPALDGIKLAGDAIPAVEQLLVSLLGDRERRFSLRGFYGDVSYEDPRICDLAAFALSKRWPEKYPFRWIADVKACDSQIAVMQNQWRAAHGLPPLRPASPVIIPPAKEADVAPLLDAYLAASDEAARKTARARIIETFGLSALPIVQSRLETSKDAALLPLAIGLASVVREIAIEPGSEEKAAQFGIDTLRGRPLEGGRLAQLAGEMETKLPAEMRGVAFYAERTGDGTGFKVTVSWLPGTVPMATGWDRQITVRGGGQEPFNQSGYSASRGGPTNSSEFRQMAKSFSRALQAPFDGPVIVRFRIERSSP